MNLDDAFERCLVSLHEVVFEDARCPAASDQIDEACGIGGNACRSAKHPVARTASTTPAISPAASAGRTWCVSIISRSISPTTRACAAS